MSEITDTPSEIAGIVHRRLMQLSGAERFGMGVRMFDAARRMVLASLPTDISDAERKRLLYERIYGECWPDDAIIDSRDDALRSESSTTRRRVSSA